MIRTEYLNFLQTLGEDPTLASVRKVANLVLNNLNVLIPLTTTSGQRIRKIVDLGQSSWSNANSDISVITSTQTDIHPKLTRLKKLTVGPFRGFSRQEFFDLDSRIILIYGPNGTGKTSFCEALEYALLGSVEEAGSKRFRNQNDYLKNAHVNMFTTPVLEGLNEHGVDIEVLSDPQKYQFCFIEKNRIDNFSRIAAQVPARQSELISTLFGLDSFNEFVRNFTSEMDDRYIDLVGLKAKTLEDKKRELLGAQQQIQLNTELLQEVGADRIKLANEYKEGITFDQMVSELCGKDDAIGLVKELENVVQSPLNKKSSLISSALLNIKKILDSLVIQLNGLDRSLLDHSQEISFKVLYLAIMDLKQKKLERCPACQTSLESVATDPYAYAENELDKLGELTQIQEQRHEAFNDFKEILQQLIDIIRTCTSFYPTDNCLISYTTLPEDNSKIEWWKSLSQVLVDGIIIWSHIEVQVESLEAMDIQIDQEFASRQSKIKELERCRSFVQKIIELRTKGTTIINSTNVAKLKIDNFETDNAQLIAEVEEEKIVLDVNREISIAYSNFVRKLQMYCNSLPECLVTDLEGQVVSLYNAFNRNDRPSELIARIKLPITSNQRMEISFNNNPTRYFDALHVLSEGHIRCVGLAIVLAKNLKEESPLVIFDDPVNAIDDEHREAIRKTLFVDDYFANKQILVACHGEEFFKDICNLLPRTQVGLAKNYVFLPRLDDQHINIDFQAPSRNYILAARQHIERNEVRDALTKSRQALEAITKEKIWSYVSKYGDGNLSLKLRSAKSPIELRNLTEQLKSKIGKADFAHTEKNNVYEPLDRLLGVNGESREWRYLNKGTHEEQDRAEFDRQTVVTIISSLEHIDTALTQYR